MRAAAEPRNGRWTVARLYEVRQAPIYRPSTAGMERYQEWSAIKTFSLRFNPFPSRRQDAAAQSGAVAGLSIKDGKVYLSIAIDPKQSAAMEPMRVAAEAAVKQLGGVANALVSLTADLHPPPQRRRKPRSRAASPFQGFPTLSPSLRARRRRQIDNLRQSRAGARLARLARRHSRRGYLRTFIAAPSRAQGQAGGRRPPHAAARSLWRQGYVDWFSRRGRDPMIWRGPWSWPRFSSCCATSLGRA